MNKTQPAITPLAPTLQEFGHWLRSQTPGHGSVKATVLHHTWSPTAAQYAGRQTIVNIRNYHMRTLGWSDIGANAYACPDGTVVTGRPLSASNWSHALVSRSRPEAEARAVSGGDKLWFNHFAFGLETVANFDSEPLDRGPSGVSYETALRVLTVVHTVYKLPASRLFFHRDVADKSCPGRQLDRAKVRAELDRRLRGAIMADVDGWAAAYVERAIEEGLMTRGEDGKFRGNDPTTRQETAVVLVRLLDKMRQELRLDHN
jgi:hypothetical protein